MSYFFAIILILIIIWMFFGPQIKQWAKRRMMEKVEDAFRAQMGMPSAKDERKRRREQQKAQRREQRHSRNQTFHTGAGSGRSSQSVGDTLIPREYAEDVEFVEYKEFSETTTTVTEEAADGKKRKIVTESQVSDVEYVEIKSKE